MFQCLCLLCTNTIANFVLIYINISVYCHNFIYTSAEYAVWKYDVIASYDAMVEKNCNFFFRKLENLKINAPLFEPDCYSSHVYFLPKKWKNSLYSLMISRSTKTRSRLFTKIMSLHTSRSMILNRKNIIWLYALTSVYRIYVYIGLVENGILIIQEEPFFR